MKVCDCHVSLVSINEWTENFEIWSLCFCRVNPAWATHDNRMLLHLLLPTKNKSSSILHLLPTKNVFIYSSFSSSPSSSTIHKSKNKKKNCAEKQKQKTAERSKRGRLVRHGLVYLLIQSSSRSEISFRPPTLTWAEPADFGRFRSVPIGRIGWSAILNSPSIHCNM